MKMKKVYKFATLCMLSVSLLMVSCDDFLSETPDNRIELDSEEKIISMLVSAYPESTYITACEFSSDNVDKLAVTNPSNDLMISQLYNWQDATDEQNDSPTNAWSALYKGIASANQALAAIEAMDESKITDNIMAAKGEALVARAFNHFILVNMFCQAYYPASAQTDIGIPYIQKPETQLNPQYDRGTVAHVYEMIEKDLEEGLPLINDVIYTIPKFHFNRRAAYGFAARFYLFYQKYERAVECANSAIGLNPESMMRDWQANGQLGIESADGQTLLRTMDYVDSSHNTNLLMLTSASSLGLMFGPYSLYTEMNHGSWLNTTETVMAATAPWRSGFLRLYSATYSFDQASLHKTFVWKMPYLFEFTDPVNLIGISRSVSPAITVEEVMLCRAEANIMLKNYDAALVDMNLWASKLVSSGRRDMTVANIEEWMNDTPKYLPSAPTVIKTFELPTMAIEAGTQEAMMYAVAHARRVETVHAGLRWFDLKRYGIRVHRRTLASSYELDVITDQLGPRDPRFALQLPPDVISAGMEPNPR